MIYETKACGRCGGGGKYSYNMIHGDVCYGCSGTGKQLTKRGAATKAYFNGLCKKPAGEVKPGDQVMCSIGIAGPKRWHRVDSIECSLFNRAHNQGYLVLHLKRGKSEIAYHLSPESMIDSVRDQADLDAKKESAAEYQARLGVNGKPLKRAA